MTLWKGVRSVRLRPHVMEGSHTTRRVQLPRAPDYSYVVPSTGRCEQNTSNRGSRKRKDAVRSNYLPALRVLYDASH
jgi:hypothetical protein